MTLTRESRWYRDLMREIALAWRRTRAPGSRGNLHLVRTACRYRDTARTYHPHQTQP